MDYGKNANLILGRGPTGKQLTPVCNAVMDAIGRNTAAVVGAGGDHFDSTMISLQRYTI